MLRMHRRTLLAAPLLLPAGHALAQGQPPGQASGQPQPLTERDRADIGRVETYLNGLRSLKARFLQIAQNGAAAEGTCWIVRPNRMRFEYDPPEPLLLVASHGQFFYFDRELKQASTVPVSSTPLGMLLRDTLRLSGDVTVARIERAGGLLRVTIFRTGKAQEGRLTLIFSENPMELKQWAVVDAQGRETRVTLSQPEWGGRYDPFIFEFNDPRFREQLGIQ